MLCGALTALTAFRSSGLPGGPSPTIRPMAEPPIATIDTLHRLLEISPTLATAFDHSEIWWRGHARPGWTLVPGVFRDGRPAHHESNMTLRFFRKARTRHSPCPLDTDWPGWLFLMQHYRLPTRLLDWTESCLVAAFFAVTDYLSEDGILWALNPFELNRSQTGLHALSVSGADSLIPLFRAAFGTASKPSDKILPVMAPEVDLRMLIQQSTFTIHGTATPIDALPGAASFTRRFTIPAAAKPFIGRQLAALGIRASTLFPDLEHLAQDLSRLAFDPVRSELPATPPPEPTPKEEPPKG